MKRTYFLTLALAAALAGGCRGSDDQPAATAGSGAVGTSGAADVKGDDKDFARGAAITAMAEVELGQLVLQRSNDPNIKKFAQMMIDDHTKGGNALKAVAARHQIELPTQIDEKHRDMAEALGKKQGLEFDREYASMMVDGHQSVVDKLESRIDKDTLAAWKTKNVDPATGGHIEAKGEAITVVPEKSDDPVTFGLNEWAATAFPTTFAHLQAAKDLKKGVERRTTTP